MEQNHIELIGCLASAPQYSHSNHGRHFYSFFLEVSRLSGAVDRLPILAAFDLLDETPAEEGDCLRIAGQLRSFNNRLGSGRKLVISLLAEEIEVCDRLHDNRVELRGVVCKEPVYRRTPLGREICDLMLAVNRPYHRADYLPCILWGHYAQEGASYGVGTPVAISGRFQSRQYIKVIGGIPEERTAYEISAITAHRAEEE